jgi:hypothetical protein
MGTRGEDIVIAEGGSLGIGEPRVCAERGDIDGRSNSHDKRNARSWGKNEGYAPRPRLAARSGAREVSGLT